MVSTNPVSTDIAADHERPWRLEQHASPEAIAGEWQALEATGAGSLFQSCRWLSAWCETAAQAHGETPLIIAGRDRSGALAFVWPFALVPRLGGPVLSWLGIAQASYGAGVYRAGVAEALDAATMRGLLAEAAGLGRACGARFEAQPERWPPGETANPFAGIARQPAAQGTYELPLSADFEALMRAHVSSQSRSLLKRRRRQLSEVAALSLEVTTDPAASLPLLDLFFAQKAAQLGDRGIANPFANPAVQRFLRRLATAEGEPRLEAAALRLAGTAAAINIGITWRGRYHLINSSMAAGEARRWSPGLVLMHDHIQHHCRAGTRCWDFGPGSGQHKDLWSASYLPCFETHVALRASGWPAASCSRLATATKHAIKQNPAALQAARRLRERLRAVRARVTRA